MSRASELRELSLGDLNQKLAETRRDLFKLRFAVAVGQSTDTASLGKLKRETARLLTVIREKQSAQKGML
jgi:large subunit ribosomal protein L29